MPNSGAASEFEALYRPTEAELEDLRAYRENAEPPETDPEQEAFEDDFEALTPTELEAISPEAITEKFAQSEKAVNFVINFEVGSPTLYTRKYASPIWPKGMSGITIGIGFDIGYHNEAEFAKAWQAHLSPEHFDRLKQAIGFKTGRGGNRATQIARARQFVRELSDIEIDFDIAKKVFLETTVPLHGRRALKVFAHMMELHPHSFGALFSLAYNRGTSMGGKRRREMREIRDAMKARRWKPVPGEIRDMKRIWRGRGLRGLLRRRDGEARLFEEGLDASRSVVEVVAPVVAAQAGASMNGTTGGDDQHKSAHDLGLESIDQWQLTEDNQYVVDDEAEGDGAEWSDHFEAELEAEQFEYEQQLESRSRDWARVRWIEDEKSTEYRHMGDSPLKGCVFDFDAGALENLIALNRFEPLRENGKIIFGLRGAELLASTSAPDERLAQENKTVIRLKDVRPNHKDFRCVLGVYDLNTRLLSAYIGSTVPCRRAIWGFVNGGSRSNMLPTGLYRYKVGFHKKIPGCLREDQDFCVLRNTDDYRFDIRDKWDPGFPADNLHPSFFYEKSAEFSSWGCITVRGTYKRASRSHRNEWGRFRKALGLTASGSGDHGKRFSLMILTGLDAAIAGSLNDATLMETRQNMTSGLRRLRPGSQGAVVKRLQKVLKIKDDGIFGPLTRVRLAALQRSKLDWSDGIYMPAMDEMLGLNIFNPAPVVEPIATAAAGASNGSGNGSGADLAAMPDGDREFEALYLELGKRSEIARSDQEAFTQSHLPEYEGMWDESGLIKHGKQIFGRIEKSLHGLVCGDREEDQKDREEFQNAVNQASGYNADVVGEMVTNSLSRLISAYMLLPGPVADVAATIVVKRIIIPTLGEISDTKDAVVGRVCTIWARSMRAEQVADKKTGEAQTA